MAIIKRKTGTTTTTKALNNEETEEVVVPKKLRKTTNVVKKTIKNSKPIEDDDDVDIIDIDDDDDDDNVEENIDIDNEEDIDDEDIDDDEEENEEEEGEDEDENEDDFNEEREEGENEEDDEADESNDEEDDEVIPNIQLIKLNEKGRRLYDPRYAEVEFTENVRSANLKEALACFVTRLMADPVIRNYKISDFKTKDDQMAYASHIAQAFEQSVLDVNIIKHTGFPFLGGKLIFNYVPTKHYKAFGEHMTNDVLKLEHLKATIAGGEYSLDKGITYQNNGISELSIAGKISNENENNFVCKTDGIFTKPNDVINKNSGKKIKSASTKNTKKSVKNTNKKNIKKK